MGGRRGGERRGWVDWGRRWRDRAGEKGERRKQLGGAGRRRKEQEIGWRGRKVGEMIRKGRDQEMGRWCRREGREISGNGNVKGKMEESAGDGEMGEKRRRGDQEMERRSRREDERAGDGMIKQKGRWRRLERSGTRRGGVEIKEMSHDFITVGIFVSHLPLGPLWSVLAYYVELA
jgi:hypothetical protein